MIKDHDLGQGWKVRVDEKHGALFFSSEREADSIALTPASVETLRKILNGQ